MHGSKPVQVCPVSFCLHGECVLDKDRTLLHSQNTQDFLSVCMRAIERDLRVADTVIQSSHSPLLWAWPWGWCPLERGQQSGSDFY